MNILLKKKGFSIVEMILVSSLIPVIGLAVYSTFNSGIKIYQRINKNLPLEDINLFLDDFHRSLRNTFIFKEWEFSGETERLEFSSLVYEPIFKTEIPGRIIYLYQPERKKLLRQELSYLKIYKPDKYIRIKAIENIYNFRFQYYYYQKEKDTYIWQDTDYYGKMPLAVRMEFDWFDDKEAKHFVYNVFIPAAE